MNMKRMIIGAGNKKLHYADQLDSREALVPDGRSRTEQQEPMGYILVW